MSTAREFIPQASDENVMREAAQHFVGEHDFAAVRSIGTEVKSTVRTVYYYDVQRDGDIHFPQGLRERLPLQHGARDGRDGRLCCQGKKFPPESVRTFLQAATRRRADGAARKETEHDKALVTTMGRSASMSDNAVTHIPGTRRRKPAP